MTDDQIAEDARRWLMRRSGRLLIGAFWSVQFVALSLANLIEEPGDALFWIWPRALVLVVGFTFSMTIIEAAVRVMVRPFRTRVAVVMCASALASALLIGFNFFAFMKLVSHPDPFNLSDFMLTVLIWCWFFVSEGAAVLALTYSFDLQDRERRLGEVHRLAERSRLMALRFQLNPHFLFNTLNSVVALASRDGNLLIEEMVKNLADFLRSTLELDPLAQITLGEEIKLQLLYLTIEEVRFASRLRLEYSLPTSLEQALVPALILQPLVENAVKHGLGTSVEGVDIRIGAEGRGDRLAIFVENGVGSGVKRARGTGVGLANVRARLEATYGDAQNMGVVFGDDKFRVEIELPLALAGERPFERGDIHDRPGHRAADARLSAGASQAS